MIMKIISLPHASGFRNSFKYHFPGNFPGDRAAEFIIVHISNESFRRTIAGAMMITKASFARIPVLIDFSQE